MRAGRVVPKRADVVVIGAGIVGCSTAWFLAQRGFDVVLIDKGQIAHEQSSRAWGFVRQQGRDPHELPLMIAANKLWQELPARLATDIEWVQEGNLALAGNEQRLDEFRSWQNVARDFGIDTHVLGRNEVLTRIPELEGPYIGGMLTPSDGHAEPLVTTRAIANAARFEGATIRQYCVATGFELTGGRISAVLTDRGTIRTDLVVCAAGLNSTRVARMLDLHLPQIAIRSTVAETEPTNYLTGIGAWAPQASFRQRRTTGTFYVARGATSDHDLTFDSLRFASSFLPNLVMNRKLFQLHLGRELFSDFRKNLPRPMCPENPFADTIDVNPEINRDTARRSRDGIVDLFPVLQGIRIQRAWAGLIDSTPDAIPVIGPVPKPQGFILATGFSGHGFAMGPIVGKLLTELIATGEPSIDLHAMRFSRFAEGDIAAPRNVL
jgi:glycine/D-amino acid oxidase-like deaminating enzyme